MHAYESECSIIKEHVCTCTWNCSTVVQPFHSPVQLWYSLIESQTCLQICALAQIEALTIFRYIPGWKRMWLKGHVSNVLE